MHQKYRQLGFHVCLAAMCISGCSRDDGSIKMSGERLHGSVLINEKANQPLPHLVSVAGPAIFVAGENDTMIYVFNRFTGRRVLEVGRRGAGPGEFRWVQSMQPQQTRGRKYSMWAFDAKLGRLTGFDIIDDTTVVMDSSFLSLGSYESVGWLDDSTLVGIPFFSKNRFMILNVDGTVRDSAGLLPLIAEGVPISVAHEIYFPSVAVRPLGKLVAVGARFAGRIDMYDHGNHSVFAADVPVPYPPIVNQGFNGAIAVHRITGQTTFGYLSLAATNERLYGLFSGRSMASCHECAWYGDQVHIFDWAGKLLSVIDLDADAIGIAAAEDDKTLYTVNRDPMPIIRSYPLHDR